MSLNIKIVGREQKGVHVVHGQGLLLVPGSLRLPCQLLGVSLMPPYVFPRGGFVSIANHANPPHKRIFDAGGATGAKVRADHPQT